MIPTNPKYSEGNYDTLKLTALVLAAPFIFSVFIIGYLLLGLMIINQF